jgi:hypothetical protein
VFSSDRSIQDYANTIWHVNSVLKGWFFNLFVNF